MGEQMNSAAVEAARVKVYRVIGLFDAHGPCELCGKQDIQRMVGFEEIETGAELYTGTTCAETVAMMTITDEDPTPKVRTARQMLTTAQKIHRERAIAESIEALEWQIVALIDAVRETVLAEGGALLESYWLMPERSRVRHFRFASRLSMLAYCLSRVQNFKTAAKREKTIAGIAEQLEAARKAWIVRGAEERAGMVVAA